VEGSLLRENRALKVEITRADQPEPETPEPWPEQRILLKKYAHRGLQVILKLANIEVTPKKPEHSGGAWHAQGELIEHICAAALYY
jgi:hypothetical protein